MTALLSAASTSDKIKTANSMPHTLSGNWRISGIVWSFSKSGGIFPISNDRLLGHQGSLIIFLSLSTSLVLTPWTEPMRGRRVLLALIIAFTSTSDAILNGPEQCPTENVLGTVSPLILRHDEDLFQDFRKFRTSGGLIKVSGAGSPESRGPYIIGGSIIQNIKSRLD